MSSPGNAIQQLSNVPVQTPPLVIKIGDKGQQQIANALTLGWMQWFQAVWNAIKYLYGIAPVVGSGVPANPTTPVGFAAMIQGGQLFYVKLYQ